MFSTSLWGENQLEKEAEVGLETGAGAAGGGCVRHLDSREDRMEETGFVGKLAVEPAFE